jgi:hypothetical protein
MAEICIVCNKEITEDEGDYRDEGAVMHFRVCRPEYFKKPEKYGRKATQDLTPGEREALEELKRKQELREKSKGMVLTDIDLPFGRVFWVSFQFLVVGLVLAIPVWILFMVLFSLMI